MEETQKISQYNEASLQIFRLNNIWQECHYHRSIGNLNSYKTDLEKVEDELSGDIRRLDEKISKKEDQFQMQLNKINFFILKYQILKKFAFFYQSLQEKHRLLKYIQDKAGKGTKLKDADEDEFD